MSIYMANITPRERSKAMAYGTGLGTVGMLAYHLPVTQSRYVNAAFDVVKNEALDNIDGLNDTALSLTKHNNVTPEESITDPDTIKLMKQGFADSFEVCKKNVVERDAVSMKAFKKIKWTNLAWGASIGAILGFVMGMIKAKDPQLSYFE